MTTSVLTPTLISPVPELEAFLSSIPPSSTLYLDIIDIVYKVECIYIASQGKGDVQQIYMLPLLFRIYSSNYMRVAEMERAGAGCGTNSVFFVTRVREEKG